MILSSDLSVNDVVSQPGADIAELGDPDGDLPDEVHLAAQELVLQEITEMRVAISHPVGGEQTLIYYLIFYLQFSLVPEPPEKQQEGSPMTCSKVLRWPGRRPFLRVCSDTELGSPPETSWSPLPGRRT